MEMIGKKVGPVQFSYTEKDVILYALGIGAGTEELQYIYEKNLKVYPTFAVIPTSPAIQRLLPVAGLNMPYVVHGAEKVTIYAPLPTEGSLSTTAVWTSVYDKGKSGAIINLETETKDANGQKIFGTEMVLMDRSAGNFGGDSGPKTNKTVPPEAVAPDFRVEHQTAPNQGAIYRLSADMNPLHIDPEFAKKAGFQRPILHGLCSYGFALRSFVQTICKGDADRIKSFGVRFSGVVYAGETLVTEGWKTEGDVYSVQTKTGDGRVVLRNGSAEIR